VIRHGQVQRLSDLLEGVAEHAVAHVMQQSGCQRDLSLILAKLPRPVTDNVALDDFHERACNVEDADAVGEASVGSTGKDELGKAQLSDAAQPLERWCLDYAPERALELTGVEFDEVMDRVADALRLDGHSAAIASNSSLAPFCLQIRLTGRVPGDEA